MWWNSFKRPDQKYFHITQISQSWPAAPGNLKSGQLPIASLEHKLSLLLIPVNWMPPQRSRMIPSRPPKTYHKLGPPLVVRTSDPFLVRILLLGRPRRRRLGRVLFCGRHLEVGPAAARYTSDFRDLFTHTVHTQLSPGTVSPPVVNAVPMTNLRNNLSVLRHHCFLFKVDLPNFWKQQKLSADTHASDVFFFGRGDDP